MNDSEYIKSTDVYYPTTLKSIKKSDIKLQPIYEVFTNSIEAHAQESEDRIPPIIIVRLYHQRTALPNVADFEYVEVEDNGVGFNETNFDRFKMLGDDRKSKMNRGFGRVQLLHYFNKSEYSSIFKNRNGELYERFFVLSKSGEFLKENAIILVFDIKPTREKSTRTIVRLKELLDKNDDNFYNNITSSILKKHLISHYLPYFCSHRERMPQIRIEQYYNGVIEKAETQEIAPSDIPKYDEEKQVEINYAKLSEDGKDIIKSTKNETLNLKAYRIQADKLSNNAIRLTVKSEIVENKDIELQHLRSKDQIDNNRYLFLLSGNYLDNLDGNTRGDFFIPTAEEFKKKYSINNSMFGDEEIVMEDLVEKTNSTILTIYSEIEKNIETKQVAIDRLKEMFLLNDETVKSIGLGLSDTDETVLEKVYKADAKISAKKDAKIKEQIDQLNSLAPTDPKYEEELQIIVKNLVKEIPQQNRTALTCYVARRDLVLGLFQKILDRKLAVQNIPDKDRNFDEKLLHSLIFQQNSENAEVSDLWLFNEEFIYFKGISEAKLKDVKIAGDLIFRDDFDDEEMKYLKSLGENRTIKRPDILLFPSEGKCIIIEFKNPDVAVRAHLGQIDFYAGLLRNFTKDKYNLDTFYGYLVGQSIEPTDVRLTDSRYMHSCHFDYMFRPSTPVAGIKITDGSLYVEVLKYSTLLERAKIRNKIFIDKIKSSSDI